MDQAILFFKELWLVLKSGQLPQLGLWDYVFLSVLVAIEGPVATLLGAAAASAGLMRPPLVFLAAALGNLTSDALWYSLGRVGKIDWLLHWGRWIGLRPHHLEKLKQGMQDHAIKILLIAKLTVSVVIPSLIAAGLAKVPWRKWFPAIFTGEMIWTGALVLTGYFATEGIKKVEKGVGYIILTASTITALLLLIWLVRKLFGGQIIGDAGLVEKDN